MVKCWLIFQGNHPSLCHTRYLNEEDARKEADRLERIRAIHNKRIEESPAKGFRGAAFLNIKNETPWSYKEMEFPE